MARSWYAHIGNDPLNIRNYVRLTAGKHQCLCGPILCAIYATDNTKEPFPLHPLSNNLQQYIKKALVTGQLQPEIPYNTKKYVYLRY